MNRLVLIADGQAGRGRLLAAACRASGMPSKLVTHGAAALELALSSQPALIVAQLELPLVDGFKLAEILRANPRTRGVRFLFLAEEAGRLGELGAVGDELLLASASRDEMVARISELIERQDRIETLDAASQGGGRVTGELTQTSLADLLQLFHVGQRSGHIEIELEDELDGRPLGKTGRVAICEGEVIRAEIGEIHGEKALFRMLRWRCGRFVFEPAELDEPPAILMSTGALLVEGIRQSSEWERMALEFPPLEAEIRLHVSQSELPNIVHPLTQEVLLLVEIYPRVGDVVDRCSYPDYQVLRTLHTLAQREIVELRQVALPAPETVPAEPAESLLDAAQTRRLRDWVESAGLQGRVGTEARIKLLVAASDAGAILDFVHLFEGVPGAELDACTTSRPADQLAGNLFSLGRIGVDEGIALDLVHVPADARFAPIWPIAGHGALATLFLLHGPVGAAAERVRAMTETLGSAARSRIFHVVLLGKGERVSPDDLRENLALIDESSVFLLPLESAKEPLALLRSLFARIVGGATQEMRA